MMMYNWIEIGGETDGTTHKLSYFEKGSPKNGTVLITAGVHGAEETSILAVMKLISWLNSMDVQKRVLIVPVCNLSGFHQHSNRIVPEDGQNLNRVFPPKPTNHAADLIARTLVESFVLQSDWHMDLHGGDIRESVMPFVYYAGVGDEEMVNKSREMALATGFTTIVKSNAQTGFYNHSGILGKPSILMERGGAGVRDEEQVTLYFKEILNVLCYLGVVGKTVEDSPRQVNTLEIQTARYPLAAKSGFWVPSLSPGQVFEKGETLGVIYDVQMNELQRIIAEGRGIVLYQVMSLGIYEGSETVAYGLLE